MAKNLNFIKSQISLETNTTMLNLFCLWHAIKFHRKISYAMNDVLENKTAKEHVG